MTIAAPRRAVAVTRSKAIGTDVVLAVSDPGKVVIADDICRSELAAFDVACSRFRPDSEISQLHRRGARWTQVSDLLFDAVAVAVAVAESTEGAVDPTVGSAMNSIGYDRDFALLSDDGPSPEAVPAPGWQLVELDVPGRRLRIPSHVRLDLGATTKALAADRIASRVAAIGTSVMVSLGGDVSVAGPEPVGGWPVGIAGDSSATEADDVIALYSGGVASSSTRLRRWIRGGQPVHHIVDPRTGKSAPEFWHLVTVAGSSCVDANAWSTAAIVWGSDALRRLVEAGRPARLVRHDGHIVTTPGWPG